MTNTAGSISAAHLHGWFRRDVTDKLEHAVGGPARLRVVVLLAGVLGLDSADKATIGAVAAQLEQALGIGNTEIGLLVTVSTAVGALATLPIGALTDRVNRVKLLSGAIVVWSVAMLVSGASTSYLMLLLTRLALGAVVAAAGPTVASLTGDLFPAADRGRIYGFILSGELLGAGLGVLISGDVAAVLSWRWSFWLLALPGFVLAVVLKKLLPEPARGGQSLLHVGDRDVRAAEDVEDADEATGAGPEDSGDTAAEEDDEEVRKEVEEEGIRPHAHLVPDDDPTERSLWWAAKYVLSVPTNRVLILASALGYFFFSGLRTFAVLFLQDQFGIGQGAASTLIVVIGAGAIVGVLIAGRTADTLIHRRHISGRPIVAGVSFLLAAVLFLPGLLTTSLLIAGPLFFLAAAGLGGANPPLDAARLDLMHPRLWGRAEAVRTVLRSSLEAVAPLLFGYVSTLFGGQSKGFGEARGQGAVSNTGLQQTFLLMLIPLLIAGLVALLRARRTYPRDVATAIAYTDATRGKRSPQRSPA